ncbi:hypothetical protein Q31b_58160 [Novipirellula aureliae]|uniref:Uncharacterized protein n=1 Tax=Novipirellula aureliae TaxID=2527966 RepID=A0A5C6D6G3_9BACT|nr:hypothetical protein [Novipirellula aureliae]TWU32773.1 hypothetical protein Q31b_58160 [Novipirellula aureliae]
MKSIFLALMFATPLNAGDSWQCTSGGLDAAASPVFDKDVAIADEPVFDFPISRAIGVDIDYRFEPPQMPEQRVFSFLIALSR